MATTPLFVPSTRYVDLIRQRGRDSSLEANFTEQEISVENVQALFAMNDDEEKAPAEIPSEAYQEFETALGRGVVWLGSEIFVGYSRYVGNSIVYSRQFSVYVDEETSIHARASPSAREEDVALGCSLLFRLLETSGVTHVKFSQLFTPDDEPLCVVPGPVLSRFLTKTASLEKFTADRCRFCEPHIRALSDASVRPELEVILNYPHLTPSGKLAFRASMQQNQGPTELLCTTLEARLLTEAIPGNTRLKKLTLCGSHVDNSHEYINAVVQSFSEDKGIQELKIQLFSLRDETWELLSGALAEHPKLNTLEFMGIGYLPLSADDLPDAGLPKETKLFRVQQIVELLKTNTVLTSVDLNFDHALIATEIEPRLRINRFRLKVKAITKETYAWRRPLVGRALDAVDHRDAATLQFMLLTINADVLVSNEAPRNMQARQDRFRWCCIRR